MRVIQRGHYYQLDHRNGKGKTFIQYVNKEPGQECEGVIQQELLRMMLDRNRYCNNCLPHRNNELIQHHLQMALILHETRALERKIEKGELMPEYLATGDDGHIQLSHDVVGGTTNQSTELIKPAPREGVCKYTSHIKSMR